MNNPHIEEDEHYRDGEKRPSRHNHQSGKTQNEHHKHHFKHFKVNSVYVMSYIMVLMIGCL